MGSLISKLTSKTPSDPPQQQQQQPVGESAQKKEEGAKIEAAVSDDIKPSGTDDVIKSAETGIEVTEQQTSTPEAVDETVQLSAASETLSSVPDKPVEVDPTPVAENTSNEIQTSADPVEVEKVEGDSGKEQSACIPVTSVEAEVTPVDVVEDKEEKVEEQHQQPESGSLSATDVDISEKLEELNLTSSDASHAEDHHHDDEQQQQQPDMTSTGCESPRDECHVVEHHDAACDEQTFEVTTDVVERRDDIENH